MLFHCSSCKLEKSKVLPLSTHDNITTKYFDLNHSDVWWCLGIASVFSHLHHKYFVTFIDNYRKFTCIYFLHAKFEVIDAFNRFLVLVETQFKKKKKIKILCSDLGEICCSWWLSIFFYKIRESSPNKHVIILINKMG